MKLKVYDSGKRFEGYIDRYTLYFPYPKWLQQHDRIKAMCQGFSFSDNSEQIIVCCHFEDNWNLSLGKRIKTALLPEHVQKWVAKEEKSWNEELQKMKAA